MADNMQLQKTDEAQQDRSRLQAGRTFVPHVDILENDEKLLLLADLPGVQSDDLDIRYERGELTLTARVQPRPMARTSGPPLLQEYEVGDFRRTFRIGELIDAARIEADLRDGVLQLHLPKQAEARPRQIPVHNNN